MARRKAEIRSDSNKKAKRLIWLPTPFAELRAMTTAFCGSLNFICNKPQRHVRAHAWGQDAKFLREQMLSDVSPRADSFGFVRLFRKVVILGDNIVIC
jgi:hypothetical protein